MPGVVGDEIRSRFTGNGLEEAAMPFTSTWATDCLKKSGDDPCEQREEMKKKQDEQGNGWDGDIRGPRRRHIQVETNGRGRGVVG